MLKMPAACVALAATIAVVAAAPPVCAQSTAQIPLQFDFLTPGARSMGMGGAFLGAADDTTAAFTNPAGLALLKKREFSVEGRFRRFETPYLSGGRISGSVTGRGLDTIPGPVYENDVDEGVSLTFLSYLWPLSYATLTFYRHELASIDNTFFSSGVFERFTFGGITDDAGRETPLGGTRRVRIASYGATIGRAVNGRLAVGGGVSLAHLTLDSSFARFGFESLFGAPRTDIRSATATQTSDDVSVSANAGVLFKVSRKVQVGATVRRGPRFSFTQEDRVFDAGLDLRRTGTFKVPDVWGAGVGWLLKDDNVRIIRVLVDYDFVRYAQLKRDYIDFQAISSNRQDQVRLDNGHEVHVGIEYALYRQNRRPLAFRAGVWYDPAHAPRYVSTPAHDELDVLLGATLPGGKDLVHYAFGSGVVLGALELNGAADLSSRTTYLTVSAVVRF